MSDKGVASTSWPLQENLEKVRTAAAHQPKRSKRMRGLLNILASRHSESFALYDPSLKAIYHRRNFSLFLRGHDSEIQPVTAEVVPSLECNFRCPYCTYWQNRSMCREYTGKRLMNPATYERILTGLKDLRTKGIIITGGGEPTLHPEWLEFMRLAVESSYYVGLYTNGSMLREREVECLMRLEPSFVRVSLNAGTSNLHKRIHGYGEKKHDYYRKVLRSIVMLGQAKRELRAETTLGIGFILSGKNSSASDLAHIAETVLWLQRETDGAIDYAAFRPEVRYFDNQLQPVLKQPDHELFAKLPERLANVVERRLRPAGVNVLVNHDGFRTLSSPATCKPNIATPWSISFDYDGEMYISCERNGMRGFNVGSVKHASVREIWCGGRRTQLRAEMASGKIQPAPYYKLKLLNDLLWEIRDLGVFRETEVEEVYECLGREDVPIPSYANFI